MTLRKLESMTRTLPDTSGRMRTCMAKVYKDMEWNEFRVKFFIDGVHQSKADYHTDNKADAQGTARSNSWCRGAVLDAVKVVDSLAVALSGGRPDDTNNDLITS